LITVPVIEFDKSVVDFPNKIVKIIGEGDLSPESLNLMGSAVTPSPLVRYP
jgi:hypothetical protein